MAGKAKKKTTASLERQLLGRYYGSLGRAIAKGFGNAVRAARTIEVSASKELVRYNPVRGALGSIGIGSALTGLALLLYPPKIAPGTLTKQQIADIELANFNDLYVQQSRRLENVETVMRNRGTPFAEPEPEIPPLIRALRGYVGPKLPEPLRQYVELAGPPTPQELAGPTLSSGVPVASGLPGVASAPAPVPAPKKPGGLLGRINKQTLQRAQLAGLGVGLLSRKKSTPAVAPLTAIEAPRVSSTSTTTTYLAGPVLTNTSSRTLTTGCSCAKKKRGPARKCLERGTVAWKTGRYKGRAAGQKCIRWE